MTNYYVCHACRRVTRIADAGDGTCPTCGGEHGEVRTDRELGGLTRLKLSARFGGIGRLWPKPPKPGTH
jgi:hypothetical protein